MPKYLKNSCWKVFKKGMKHVKVCSSTNFHIMLDKFGELLKEFYTLKLTMGFQQRLAHAIPLLVSW